MKLFNTVIIILLLLFNACKSSKPEADSLSEFSIEILDDEALQIIDTNAEIKNIAGGFTWTEGPVWIEHGKYLLFSDIPNNKVYKIDAAGDTSLYLYPSGFTGDTSIAHRQGSNGLLLSNSGELVLLQHGDRRVAKMKATLDAPSPEYETLVDSYKGKRLNSPNDGIFDTDGNLYFTDPPYGLQAGEGGAKKELNFHGVYCLLHSGELILIDSLSRPNGISLSPDGSTLYIAVSDKKHAVWYKYDITEPGKVENKTLFKDVTHLVGKEGQQGLPDGMCLSNKGYLFATGPGGVWIFNPNTKLIARIFTGQLTSNCALTSDEKTLYLTADDYILTVALK